jgi:hypothetical protein
MHIVKWIRKNERKIMAWVVILIMISFVGGYGLQQFLMYIGQGGSRQVVATYSDGKKIRAIDFQNAQNELEILRMLMADRMLGALSQMYGDLGPALLQSILFPDSRVSGEFRTQLVQLAERGQLHLNVDQIDQFFAQHQHRPEFLWILLKAEAKEVGYAVTEAEAANYLRQMVAGLTQNQMDAAFLINQVMQHTKKSENQIIRIFGQLVAVMNYSDLILGNYAVTTDEIRGSIARTMERLTAEFILLDSGPLAEKQPDPDAEQIEKQFQQFRSRMRGEFTAENPYGFGYKIPKQIQLEYFLVNLGDVQKRIQKPSSEELEGYYTRNITKYQRTEPIDPNNPDAGTRTLTRSFAQVENQIRQEMERQKAEDQAILILNEARQMTEAGFDKIEMETATAAQLQQAAGDYVAAAKELTQKYQVSIYTNKTGWLKPSDLRTDLFLRRVTIPTSADTSVRLADVLLAVPADGKPSSQPGLPAVRIWENISPLTGGLPSKDNQYVSLRAMVRVIGIREPFIPDNTDYSVKNQGVTLYEPNEPGVFSIQEQVAEDLKAIGGMEAARKQAEALAALVEKEGWDKGLKSFYQAYYPQADPNTPDPATPQLRTLSNQLVSSQNQIEALRQRMVAQSGSPEFMMRYLNALFIRKMADLMEPDQKTTGPVAKILPIEQARQVCVVKELTREPATDKDYMDNKNKTALQQAMLAKIDLGLIHFRPDSIAKRMNLKYKEIEKQPKPVEVEFPEEEL